MLLRVRCYRDEVFRTVTLVTLKEVYVCELIPTYVESSFSALTLVMV